MTKEVKTTLCNEQFQKTLKVASLPFLQNIKRF